MRRRRYYSRLGKSAIAVTSSNPVFVADWNTANTSAGSSTSTQVALPLVSAGSYNFTVDWGDGDIDTITSWNQAEVTHTYSGSGTYRIRIKGLLLGWQFNGTLDRLKLTTVYSWGPLALNAANSGGAFRGCSNLNVLATDFIDISNTFNLSQTFLDSTFNQANINNWDVGHITNMAYLFWGSTFNQPIADWDVGNVILMNLMFRNSPFNQPIGGWDVSKVQQFIDIFHTTSFNQDLSEWDVSSATLMNGMFLSSPFNQDISGWDTSSATSMRYTFYNTSAFNQDLSGWDVSGVTDCTGFLASNSSLSTANYDALLIGWESQSVQDAVPFHGGSAKYTGSSAAETARTALINDHSWTITDGGAV